VDEFKGILNLVFWFLIYWFIFRKKKKKAQAPKQKPKPAWESVRQGEPVAPPRPAGSGGGDRGASPVAEESVPRKVPPTMWDELRGMLEGDFGGKKSAEQDRKPEAPPTPVGRSEAPRAPMGRPEVIRTPREPVTRPDVPRAPVRRREVSRAPVDFERGSRPLIPPVAPARPRPPVVAEPRPRKRQPRFPELASARALRRAFVIAEVLGPPVSMRRKRGIKRLI